MNDLTRYDNDGIEIFINPTGESFASIRGVARMAGKDEKQIRRFIGADKIDVIIAEITTPGGLQGAALLSESSICKILAKYNPDRLIQFAELGIRVALHQIAGIELNTKPTIDKSKQVFNALCLRPIDLVNIATVAKHQKYLTQDDIECLSRNLSPEMITAFTDMPQSTFDIIMRVGQYRENLVGAITEKINIKRQLELSQKSKGFQKKLPKDNQLQEDLDSVTEYIKNVRQSIGLTMLDPEYQQFLDKLDSAQNLLPATTQI